MLKILIFFSTILTFFPQQSLQQITINNFSSIEATCVYSFDQNNRYSCELLNAVVSNPTDVLVISGVHMPGKIDADVEALIHRNASFAQFNGEALRKFVNLKFIDLRRVGITVVGDNAFEVCGHLEELHLGFNGFFDALPPKMLRNCENLKIFWALNSRFLHLPDDLFGNTRNLEVFDMGTSPLRAFPENLLQNMTNLRIFNVVGNFLSHLNPNNLMNARNLEEIDISWNNFSDTNAITNLLNGHLKLKKIIISNNYFEMFNLNFFTQFQRLEELAIGGRQPVTSISWHFLPISLKSLTVHEIGEEIPENAFERLQNLTFLRLNGLGITNLHRDTFKELRNLDMLMIMFTNLTTLHPQLFASQSNLRILFLNNNQIEDLPDGIFTPLVNLGLNETDRGLSLFSNKIQRLSTSLFGQHPHLDFINFAHNEIDEIERGIFSRFPTTMSRVDLAFNKCISYIFWNVTNVGESEEFELCFNNFDGITTVPPTTPGGCCSHFIKFEIFFVIFAKIFVDFLK